MLKNITIYTDGACSSKRKRGGWAAIIIYPDGSEKELSGSFPNVTNNQMEITGFLEALAFLKSTEKLEDLIINVVSDSEYLVKGASQWLAGWKLKNWKSSTGPVKNKPLWETLDDMTKDLKITFSWVKGHTGNHFNERVDKLAVEAYKIND